MSEGPETTPSVLPVETNSLPNAPRKFSKPLPVPPPRLARPTPPKPPPPPSRPHPSRPPTTLPPPPPSPPPHRQQRQQEQPQYHWQCLPCPPAPVEDHAVANGESNRIISEPAETECHAPCHDPPNDSDPQTIEETTTDRSGDEGVLSMGAIGAQEEEEASTAESLTTHEQMPATPPPIPQAPKPVLRRKTVTVSYSPPVAADSRYSNSCPSARRRRSTQHHPDSPLPLLPTGMANIQSHSTPPSPLQAPLKEVLESGPSPAVQDEEASPNREQNLRKANAAKKKINTRNRDPFY